MNGQQDNRLRKGRELLARAKEIIPGGSQTSAKMVPAGLEDAYPPFIERGEGAYVWDLDGNRYVDHKVGCGPITLGHAYPVVIEAAERQMRRGMAFGSPHPLEVELADLLTEVIPCAEMARFLKSGAEGTSAAVRVARAYTGRDLILSSGYHGWHDWSMGKLAHVTGIPQAVKDLTLDLPFADPQRLEDIFAKRGDEVAAMIISAPYHLPVDQITEYLRQVREITRKHGALLIYDEIVTGFRVSLGGLQQLTGVTPDLAVFSKGMANGFPIAAVVGNREVMNYWMKTVISSTFGGEAVSLAASMATVKEARRVDSTGHINAQGKWLKAEAERLAREVGLEMEGQGFDALPNIVFRDGTPDMARLLQRTLLLNGIFPYFPLWYITYSHTDEVMQETAAALRTALRVVAEAGRN